MSDIQYLTTLAVANLTGYSRSSIYRLVREHKIPHHRPCGRLVFRTDEIRKWMNNMN